MSKLSFKQQVDYLWSSSRWRLAAIVVAVIGITLLRFQIPNFQEKVNPTVESIFAAGIALLVAIVGLLGFSLILNVLIRVFKFKIDFHPDDYNVSSGVTEAVTTPGLRLPFAISGFIINPIGEELFFRLLILGYLSGLLSGVQYGNAIAMLVSVVAYCLMARKTKEAAEVLIIATIGIICSLLYLWYGIWYSFAANGGFVLGIYLATAAFYYLDSKNTPQHK